MRSVMSIALLLCLLGTAHARTYYFSASAGDDNRSAAQAQNPGTPWRSLQKLNAFFASLEPGDEVLLKRGDTFYGTLAPNRSGTASDPITIGAYGSGAKPVVTGFVTLDDWKSIGNGRYETYNSALDEDINMVSFDDAPQAMGRYPNASAPNGGYLNFESHGGSYIKDDELPASPSWKGAELVVRSNRYTIDRTTITSHSGSQLAYSTKLSYEPKEGFGYFIQGDVRTLDVLGEWYHNASAREMTVYFGNESPASHSVKASVLDRLLYVYDENYIVVDGLAFEGGNEKSVDLYSADYVTVTNCDISLSGIEAVCMSNGKGVKLENNTIVHTNCVAVIISNCDYALVKNNVIRNTGLFQGMGQNGAGRTTAIKETGDYNTIEHNSIENTGYIGITFKGNYVTVKNNFINNFNLIKDDGGGIYTQNANPDDDRYGQRLIGNIITNGIGAAAGTTSSVAASTTGIYMDDHASGVEIRDNTVSGCSKTGVYIHNAVKITLRGNTLYDNRTQLMMVHDLASADEPVRNIVIKGNTFFSKTPSQTVVQIGTIRNDIASMAAMDSNYYCRPLDDGYVIKAAHMEDGRYVHKDYDLKAWQEAYNKDAASKRTATQVLPHKVNSLIGSNKFTNGTFDDDVSGLSVISAADNYDKSWHSSKLDRGTFQGSASDNEIMPYILYIPIGSVSADKNYLVRFTIQDSRDVSANVFLRTAGAPYNILSNSGVKSVVRVGTSRKDYEFAFTPRYSESNTVLFFEVNGEDHTVWADNIKIQEADLSITNADDSLRLVYNPGQSGKTLPLDGRYVDARGKTYDGAITLAPYQSAVLIKKDSNVEEEQGKDDDDDDAGRLSPVVKLVTPFANANFNAPASVAISASATDPDGSITKVEYYADGKLITTERYLPYYWAWKDVPAGTYTITAKAYDDDGNVTTSSGIDITVGSGPEVTITSPRGNAKYGSISSVVISADAFDNKGSIERVEFYNGTELLKTEYTAPYYWTWEDVPAGIHTIIAKAYDNDGNVTSDAVAFTVLGFATVTKSAITAAAVPQSSEVKVAAAAKPAFDFGVFPNPAVDKIFVGFNGAVSDQKGTIVIRNLSGSTLKSIPVALSGNGVSIDVSSLRNGIYIISVKGANISLDKKFLKSN